ncbi:hypothetical protein DFP72DRAFT_838504 [Ephemerocybe angulata]|uniref:Uncharacterized protein n=1 Tax=Ephemerocybe angulata TaxID=980116 RepID=A0A8H6IHP2_9AGAR|nr:hypothetical protein DFP72DRAFT_838504 [Tulosesus angulatus]
MGGTASLKAGAGVVWTGRETSNLTFSLAPAGHMWKPRTGGRMFSAIGVGSAQMSVANRWGTHCDAIPCRRTNDDSCCRAPWQTAPMIGILQGAAPSELSSSRQVVVETSAVVLVRAFLVDNPQLTQPRFIRFPASLVSIRRLPQLCMPRADCYTALPPAFTMIVEVGEYFLVAGCRAHNSLAHFAHHSGPNHNECQGNPEAEFGSGSESSELDRGQSNRAWLRSRRDCEHGGRRTHHMRLPSKEHSTCLRGDGFWLGANAKISEYVVVTLRSSTLNSYMEGGSQISE